MNGKLLKNRAAGVIFIFFACGAKYRCRSIAVYMLHKYNLNSIFLRISSPPYQSRWFPRDLRTQLGTVVVQLNLLYELVT